MVLQFCFDNDSSTGGFHRLLLHAVAPYHGLVAVSKTASLRVVAPHHGNDESERTCRLLLVMGRRPLATAEPGTDVLTTTSQRPPRFPTTVATMGQAAQETIQEVVQQAAEDAADEL